MTLPVLTEYRQSTLRSHATCPRRTRFDIEFGDFTTGWTEAAADLGTVVHAILAEIMETLRRQGEPQMGTEEATVIAWEVYNGLEITLPPHELEAMEWMIQSFCQYRWRPERILAIEEPLRVELVCPDGEVRTVKGQPDIILADPPYGIVIIDYKTGMAKPKAPRLAPEDGATVVGKQYLSDAGLFQRQVYGLLGLHRYATARYATLRELPLRFPGEGPREAALQRAELEHVEKAVASRMLKLARAIDEGEESPLWRPRPGAHCARQCPVAMSCPVPAELRGDGAIDSDERADEVAELYVVAKAQYTQASAQLKAREEGGCRPGRANDREEVRWNPPGSFAVRGGGRKHGLWPRVDLVEAEIEGST